MEFQETPTSTEIRTVEKEAALEMCFARAEGGDEREEVKEE